MSIQIKQYTILGLLKEGKEILDKKKILKKTAWLDAEILLANILKKSKEYIYSNPLKTVSKKYEKKFLQQINKRFSLAPIAYLTGNKEFYGRKFIVNKNVLIPRPETELLIDVVTKICNEIGTKNLTIADIGTGSGCISVTLKKSMPNSRVIATDISTKALNVAKKNSNMHRVKIDFYCGNLLEPIYKKNINILAANLPYLGLKDKNPYKKILSHEPSQALYAKENGLFLYKKLFQQIKKIPHPPQAIIIEISPKQKKNIISLSKKFIPEYIATTAKDLSKRTRIVILKK